MTLCRGVIRPRDLWWLDAAIAMERPDFANAESVYEGHFTRIWRHPDRESLVSKLSRVKTAPRDNLRRYFAAQAQREIAANRIMQWLGIATAQLLGFGIPVAPWARAESLLFMRELPAHETLRVVLRRTTDEASRAVLLDRVATDIAMLYCNGYHHKDCHLENVLRVRSGGETSNRVIAGGELVWIDNDLRYSVRPARARRRLASSLAQLRYTSRDFVSTGEWRAFAQRLSDAMRATALGRTLAATTVAEFESSFE